MNAGGSLLVVVTVLAGTLGLIGLLRLVGLYAAATHDRPQDLAPRRVPPRPSPESAPSSPAPDALLAVLTAAAATELETDEVVIAEVHEVNTLPASHDWSTTGRQMIMQSHRLRH